MMDAQPASFNGYSIPFHITSPTSKDSKFVKPLYPASKSKVAKLKRSETSVNILSRSTSSLPEVCIQNALNTARELQIKPIPMGLVNKLRQQEEEIEKENISPRSASHHGVYGNATVRQDQVHFVMNGGIPESIVKCRQGTEGTVSNLPIMDAPSVPDLNCITPETVSISILSGCEPKERASFFAIFLTLFFFFFFLSLLLLLLARLIKICIADSILSTVALITNTKVVTSEVQ